jgi:hypothetical protein
VVDDAVDISATQIAAQLIARGVATPNGGRWQFFGRWIAPGSDSWIHSGTQKNRRRLTIKRHACAALAVPLHSNAMVPSTNEFDAASFKGGFDRCNLFRF